MMSSAEPQRPAAARTPTPVRLPRYRRAQNPPPFTLTDRDAQVVRHVHEHRFLTREQIQRLAFTPTTTSSCKKRLTMLYHHAYLDRVYVPVTLPYGAPRAVYCLGRRGAELLASEHGAGYGAVDWRHQDNDRDVVFLAHTLAANDVRIAVINACRDRAWRMRWTDERELRSMLSGEKIADPGTPGRAVAVIPDGHFTLDVDGARYAFALELDRGTVEELRLRQKVRLLGAWLQSGAYARRFHLDTLRVLFVVAAGASTASRLDRLRRWTEAEGGRSLFWFAEHDRVLAGDVLVDPFWQVAGRSGRYALLERSRPAIRTAARRVPAIRKRVP
jgi:hypothetical protein